MKYYSRSQHWSFNDGPKFLHTTIIFKDNSDYYITQSGDPDIGVLEPIDMTLLEPKKIPLEHISPLWEKGLTICPEPNRNGIFKKTPDLPSYDGSPRLANPMLEEARVCETILHHPHPNVALYLGCVVADGRITALCFERYSQTVEDQLSMGRKIDRHHFLTQVQRGLGHLHSLDLVHNFIWPGSIMSADGHGERFVIINFGLCVRRGSALPQTLDPIPVLDNATTAEFENDEFAFQKLIEEFDERQRGVD
ncbi:hypothetical protein B0I35DRAFT_442191 [Stachybotrys elegans]|uniref:Protein kinase domain-containing protein n=1 Tax=Stachybotrys elegans TaxID=80388 RepID=A0A8K0SL51_9HYPO|nr:hypothetical protein B0I35DRAFT_442191 [Stachybotrys elegans]